MGGFVPSPNPHTLLAIDSLTMWCPVAGERMADLHAVVLPRRAPCSREKTFAVHLASFYDWDSLVLDGRARSSMPAGDFSLGRDRMPRHLRVAGPGTISASATSSLSCRASDLCTGIEFQSVHVPGDSLAGGLSLHLAGAPLQVSNSTFSGAGVTVEAASLDVTSSTFIDCKVVVERKGGKLLPATSTFPGSASSTRPAVPLFGVVGLNQLLQV